MRVATLCRWPAMLRLQVGGIDFGDHHIPSSRLGPHPATSLALVARTGVLHGTARISRSTMRSPALATSARARPPRGDNSGRWPLLTPAFPPKAKAVAWLWV